MHKRPRTALYELLLCGLLAACQRAPAAVAPAQSKVQAVPAATAPAQPNQQRAAEQDEVPAPAQHGSCGMDEALRGADWPRRLSDTSAVEQHPWVPGTTTIAVLPDTQYYTLCEYPHLRRQGEWIAAQRGVRNIVAAIALGDLTDRNRDREWDFFAASYAPLLQSFPLLLTSGNHDLSFEGKTIDRSSGMQRRFNEAWARKSGALREVMTPGSIENAFYAIDAGSLRLGVLMLEWSPRGQTVAWANDVLTRNTDRRVIVATHAYLYHDDTRYDFAGRGDSQHWNPLAYGTAHGKGAADDNHDGEMLWNDLVRRHANVFLVLSGHVLADGTGLLSSTGDAGNTVHQVLVNYQMLDEGGLGYLRLLEILPDGRQVHMKTYSPSLGVFSYAPDQDFTLRVDPPLF
jgi:hypothetical protein